MKLYFITSNKFKKEEAIERLKNTQIELEVINIEIQEIMHLDLEVIIKDKLLKAYKEFGAPCVVEHGAIHIDALNRLPGGISKVMWDTIGDKLCQLILPGETRSATAKSIVGYCDGKLIHTFPGETRGIIADTSYGERQFQWDPIFIPEGCEKTYSQLGFPDKEKFSQAAKAWKKLINFLQKK